MSTELLVSRFAGHAWGALCESGRVVELYAEQAQDREQVGRILKARVSRILPGIQSAFVDVGGERGAFLHAEDLVLPGERETRAPIEDRLKIGRELLVQVAREPLGSKGARVTCRLSWPGRFLVLVPELEVVKISRRIRDTAERGRLEEILTRLRQDGRPVGYVVRTAAVGATESMLRDEARALLAHWDAFRERASMARAPSVIEREPDLLLRLLRDVPRDDLERIVVDREEDRRRAVEYLERHDPELVPRTRLYQGSTPLFEERGVSTAMARALRPRVWLKSGSYVIIEETEALVSIDVNTGKSSGERCLEETALSTNLEAASEIAYQLRLRNLGGIVVIDFIDMELEENRRQVLEILESGFQADRARTRVLGVSELGLVELTRERVRSTLGAALSTPCPRCFGHGRIKSPQLVATEILIEAQRISAGPLPRSLSVRAHPDVIREVRQARPVQASSADHELLLEEDPAMRPERFTITVSD